MFKLYTHKTFQGESATRNRSAAPTKTQNLDAPAMSAPKELNLNKLYERTCESRPKAQRADNHQDELKKRQISEFSELNLQRLGIP